MELLILLVSKNGQLVTRGEIAQRLWPDGVFVDTEHGINSFIRKIRLVLRMIRSSLDSYRRSREKVIGSSRQSRG
jgi:DNA-binding winged helix-turn-helix (wHTH) protein